MADMVVNLVFGHKLFIFSCTYNFKSIVHVNSFKLPEINSSESHLSGPDIYKENLITSLYVIHFISRSKCLDQINGNEELVQFVVVPFDLLPCHLVLILAI